MIRLSEHQTYLVQAMSREYALSLNDLAKKSGLDVNQVKGAIEGLLRKDIAELEMVLGTRGVRVKGYRLKRPFKKGE